MKVVHEADAFREACDDARSAGRRVGLVPTMGALHAGHLALIDHAAQAGADFRAVTIFVNPLQFNAEQDLERYPRTLATDIAACEAHGVELIFAPGDGAIYPDGFQTHVEVGEMTRHLEGEHRPGHFRGVTTVVAKLLILSGPCVAVFGRKDYQQWRTLARMVRDLGLPVDVLGHPIVREPDGLALSSRNRFLNAAERHRALAIARGLRAAAEAWETGTRDAAALRSLVLTPVEESMDAVDYVEVVDPETLTVQSGEVADATIVVAAHVGATRLIDNVELSDHSRST